MTDDKLLILRALSTLRQVRDAKLPELALLPSFHELIEDLTARLAQPEPEQEQRQKDMPCIEDDGCPTEKAVLQRFWRKHQQPEPEPVAWADKYDIDREGHDFHVSRQQPAKDGVPLYTAPPQRKEWVGLTDEDAEEVERWVEFKEEGSGRIPTGKLIRYIEAKLKEKNSASDK